MSILDTLKNNPNLFDFLIIGGGPAGMAAAIYAARAGLKVAFLEKDAPGGKMVKTATIENYPGIEIIKGPDLSLKMMTQTLNNGVIYLYGEVLKLSKLGTYWMAETNTNKKYYGRSVFIATGMVERKIGIPNEKEFYGRGISYCAICDGTLYKGCDVAVVGGGNSAVEEAIYLSGIVKNVHVIHRRNEFRADAKVVANMKKISNIHLYTPQIPIRVEVNQNRVSGITIENVNTKIHSKINVACVFPYIGLIPVVDFAKDLRITNDNGFVVVNEKMETKHQGLYAGGDVIAKSLRQVATAINDGAIAAIEAKNYLANFFKE